MKKLFLTSILFLFTVISCEKQYYQTIKPIPKIDTNSVNSEVITTPSLDTAMIMEDIAVESGSASSEPPVELAQPAATESLEPSQDLVRSGNPRKIIVKNLRVYNKIQNEGKLVYKIPSMMKVRETYPVIVRIGKSSVDIYENLDGEVTQTSIPITQTMEVNLIDPSPKDNKMFDVVADNVDVQIVDSSGSYTQWSWNVTPLRSGKSELKVVVSIIRDGNKKEEVYSDKVEIKINPLKQISFWFKNYWQWLFTTLLIPLFKWIYDNHFKKMV